MKLPVHSFVFSLTIFLTSLVFTSAYAQTGISVSPPRTYFTVNAGQSDVKKILVSNPSKTNTLELSVSLNDWEYNNTGNNIIHEAGELKTSAVSWINILPQSFFSLAPGESHEIEVQLNVPANQDTIPVHSAMLYITQINPTDGVNEHGANIKIAVRSGVKIYHRYDVKRNPEIVIENFAYNKADGSQLKFSFANTGNIWTDGTITCDLLNQETGEKISLDEVVFYSMPGDLRNVFIQLPENLKAAKYIATAMVDYEDAGSVKLAELSFNYETTL